MNLSYLKRLSHYLYKSDFESMKLLSIILLHLISSVVNAQEQAIDSTAKQLNEIVINAFEQTTNNRCCLSTRIIQYNNADRSNKTSLVNGFNTLAGVRMEERSPGSYRINIRGSSLRSPFGVRNVKVYWNDIPITDPGGNTYFNQFAFNNFTSIDIIKGPVSSMYGAGTGGLLIMRSMESWKSLVTVEYVTGSYNLQNLFTTIQFGDKEHQNKITFAHNQSDGYRDHSSVNRDNFAWVNKNKKDGKYELTSSFLYTHMNYETPGALTLTEFLDNPKSARPAVRSFPSAATAAAAIYQENVLAGMSTRYNITPGIVNATSLYGAFAQINNPTFRYYEHRSEPHFGGRSSFIWKSKSGGNEWQVLTGTEIQNGFFSTTTSKNKQGIKDTLLTDDNIRYKVYSLFLQGDVTINRSWFISTGISSGSNNVVFTRLNKYPVLKQERDYKHEYSPRVSITKKLGDLSLSAIYSKGYSPPGINELLPPTSVIAANLEAEHGNSYEIKASYDLPKPGLRFNLETFYFKLYDALVQRRDAGGVDYFVNAGDVNELGMEFTADYFKVFSSQSFDYLNAKLAYTYNNFVYGDIKKDSTLLTGKYLPGIPVHSLSIICDIMMKKNWYVNSSIYYSSKIFLNEINTGIANSYLLMGFRIGGKIKPRKNITVNIYAGLDNLLNERYSLGNDINDQNGRFYNAAPNRNYYAGLAFEFRKKK